MKLSKYNYVVKLKNEFLIWNTFNESLMSFTEENYSNLINEKFDLFSDDQIKVLIKNGILISDGTVELDNILNRRNELKNSNSSSYTIALTQNCSAHCYYCYQSENKFEKKRKLTQKDYDKIVNFIIKTKNDKAKITWFGGEPLIRSDIINYISNKLISKNVEFQSVIITNGLLLITTQISALNMWNTKEIQVTFDGLFENHDKRKSFDFGNNNFEKIIEKLKEILKNDIKVKIRINISKDNYDEVDDIFDYFENTFKDFDNFKYYYSYLTDDSSLHDYAFNKNEIREINPVIYQRYMKNKRVRLPRNRRVYCGAQNPNSFFIDIYGNVFSCEHNFWCSDKILMNINDFDYNKFENSKNTIIDKKCKECIFLPVCQGGCIRNNYNECPQFISNVVEFLKKKGGIEDERVN